MASEFEVTVEEEVGAAQVTRPHLVVLGAGASLASCPNGDANGRPLPLMESLVRDLGLHSLIPAEVSGAGDFETIYSRLHEQGNLALCEELEQRVRVELETLQLPPSPTIYDYLILSLRGSDVIASFNWDPLLLQAYCRNKGHVRSVPRLCFLHGNVLMAFCPKDKIVSVKGTVCRKCGDVMTPSPLLFPVEHKDYAASMVIADQWKGFDHALQNAFMLTIFGYRGPRSDAEALKRMSVGWGRPESRGLEQTAFIVRPGAAEDGLVKRWRKFIETHHYEVSDTFYGSWIAKHPRRTGEAWWNQYLEAKFITDNPIPRDLIFPKLWEWYEQFRPAEERPDAQEDAPRPT